jgi:hypothetical protein
MFINYTIFNQEQVSFKEGIFFKNIFHSIFLFCYFLQMRHLGHPRVTVARQSDWALFTLGLSPSWPFKGLQSPASRTGLSAPLDLAHLGHPRVTVAHQSDWSLFTLGINSSQFCSRSLFPLLSILPLRRSSQIITCKIVIFFGQTRLLWPLKVNHYIYLRKGSVFIWRNRYLNVLERNGNPHCRYPYLRFTSGSSRAVIGHLFSRGEGSRFC